MLIMKKITILFKTDILFLKLSGPGIFVEIDELKFVKRKFNKVHNVEGVYVLSFVGRTNERRIILLPVKKRDKKV